MESGGASQSPTLSCPAVYSRVNPRPATSRLPRSSLPEPVPGSWQESSRRRGRIPRVRPVSPPADRRHPTGRRRSRDAASGHGRRAWQPDRSCLPGDGRRDPRVPSQSATAGRCGSTTSPSGIPAGFGGASARDAGASGGQSPVPPACGTRGQSRPGTTPGPSAHLPREPRSPGSDPASRYVRSGPRISGPPGAETLEPANVKQASAVSDTMGVMGRADSEAVTAGEDESATSRSTRRAVDEDRARRADAGHSLDRPPAGALACPVSKDRASRWLAGLAPTDSTGAPECLPSAVHSATGSRASVASRGRRGAASLAVPGATSHAPPSANSSSCARNRGP